MAETVDQTDQQARREQDQGNGKVSGQCSCSDWPVPELPGEEQSIRRLLKTLEDKYIIPQDSPSDATKKFGDDLKGFEKDYLGLNDLVTKYQTAYDKLDCDLAEADARKAELTGWCNRIDESTRSAITKLWSDNYETSENNACKAWVDARKNLMASQECPRQAERLTEQAKEDFETAKSFEKSLKDGFGTLKTLFDRAKTLNDAGRGQAVCAITLEFCAAYNELGVLDTSENREKCGQPPESREEERVQQRSAQAGGRETQVSASPCDAKPQLNLKEVWKPENFRKELVRRLRTWILRRLQLYLWGQKRAELEAGAKKAKEAFDRIKKNRQEEFILEAEDIVTRRGA